MTGLRDDLKKRYEVLVQEMNEIQENSLQKARDDLVDENRPELDKESIGKQYSTVQRYKQFQN